MTHEGGHCRLQDVRDDGHDEVMVLDAVVDVDIAFDERRGI